MMGGRGVIRTLQSFIGGSGKFVCDTTKILRLPPPTVINYEWSLNECVIWAERMFPGQIIGSWSLSWGKKS